ncbi:MAG: glutamate--tRNA ligase family protein [Minisyncoccia bacterium]
MNTNKQIVVRMAPSPTGNLHVGGARTALFNYLFARSQNGKYILRIEDTDKERSTKEFENDIMSCFEWLGLKHDEFYRQSERTDIYRSYLQKMLDEGSAYVSKEEVVEEGQRPEVIRFKNPNKKIVFQDLIRGQIEFDTTELKDFVIARSVDEPLYHLSVVIDDFLMGITHVIRGEEHLSNTPRQILIQEAIVAPRPIYAHLPLILDSDRAKLSKRKHGAVVWVDTYKNQGFQPNALLNYLALLGWNPGTDREIFTLEELIKEFSMEKVHKGGAIFDTKKLDWINKEHIKLLPDEEQIKLIAKDFDSKTEPILDIDKIAWKDSNKDEAKKHLNEVIKILDDEQVIMKYAEEMGKGNVLWPLRYALSGLEKSPSPLILIKILGVDESRRRIEKAIELL